MFGYPEHYPLPVPGCVVRIDGDPFGVRRWRVLLHEFTPQYFTVDDMGRVTNRRVRVHVSQVVSRHAAPVPVYSVMAVGQSLTCYTEMTRMGWMVIWHMGAPFRGSHPPIRVSLPVERARALGIPHEEYLRMIKLGFSERDLNDRIGNCISMASCVPVVADLVQREQLQMVAMASVEHIRPDLWINLDTVWGLDEAAERVALIFVLQEEPEWKVFAVDPCQPLTVGCWLRAKADAAVTWAQKAVDSMQLKHKAWDFMCNYYGDAEGMIKVVVCPLPDRKFVEGSLLAARADAWHPLAKLSHPLLWAVASTAVTAVAQLTHRRPNFSVPLAARVIAADGAGVVNRSRVFRKPLVEGAETGGSGWVPRVQHIENDTKDLKATLCGIPASDPQAEWLHKWGDSIKPLDLSLLPADLLKRLPDFSKAQELDSVLFPKEPVFPNTKWIEKPVYRKPAPWYKPRSWSSFWQPSRWRVVRAIQQRMYKGLQDCVWEDIEEGIDEAWYHPEAVGTPWDAPERPGDPYTPVNVDRRPRTAINVEELCRDMGDGFSHQALRSNVWQGIDTGTQHVPLCCLFQSNMRGFFEPDVAENLSVSLGEMVDDGRKYSLHSIPPSFPIRYACTGYTAKADSSELRRTSNQSKPYDYVLTKPSGIKLRSINYEIGMHDDVICADCEAGDVHSSVAAVLEEDGKAAEMTGGNVKEPKWPEQPMPNHADVALAVSILGRLCFRIGVTLFVFVSDFRRWYHQWPYAPWVVWQVCMMWRPLPERGFHNPPHVRVNALDMGIGCASNITQWLALYFISVWSDALWRLIGHRLPFREHDGWKQWLEARVAAARAAGLPVYEGFRDGRPWACYIYGDDPCFLLPGKYITEWGLRVWHSVTSKYNLQLALPQKWQCGSFVKWCGYLHFAALGLMTITMSKRIQLQAEELLYNHPGTKDAKKYHGHVSRLCHYLRASPLTCADVSTHVKPLWQPLQEKGLLGKRGSFARRPAKVKPVVHVDEAVAKWVRVLNRALRVTPGVTVLDLLWAPVKCPETHVNYHIGGDACVGDDTPQPGLAGSMHGVAWYYALNSHECRLPIPPLEFGVMYGDAEMLLPLLPDDGVEITVHSDAATAVFDMVAGSRTPVSNVMAWTRKQILAHPQVTRMMRRLFVAHRKGASNAFDDAISRGYWDVARQLATQLKVKVRWAPVTEGFRTFMAAMVRQQAGLATQAAALKVLPAAGPVTVVTQPRSREAAGKPPVVAACAAEALAELLGVQATEAVTILDGFMDECSNMDTALAQQARDAIQGAVFGASRWLRSAPDTVTVAERVVVVNISNHTDNMYDGGVRCDRPSLLGNPFVGDNGRLDTAQRAAVCEAHAEMLGVVTTGAEHVDVLAIAAKHGVSVDQRYEHVDCEELRGELHRLAGELSHGLHVQLICHCHPKQCHADGIASAIVALAERAGNHTPPRQQLKEMITKASHASPDSRLKRLCSPKGGSGCNAQVLDTQSIVHEFAALWKQHGVFAANAWMSAAYAGYLYQRLKLHQHGVSALVGIAVHVHDNRYQCFLCDVSRQCVSLQPVTDTRGCERWAALREWHWATANSDERQQWQCVSVTAAEPRLMQCIGMAGGEATPQSRNVELTDAHKMLVRGTELWSTLAQSAAFARLNPDPATGVTYIVHEGYPKAGRWAGTITGTYEHVWEVLRVLNANRLPGRKYRCSKLSVIQAKWAQAFPIPDYSSQTYAAVTQQRLQNQGDTDTTTRGVNTPDGVQQRIDQLERQVAALQLESAVRRHGLTPSPAVTECTVAPPPSVADTNSFSLPMDALTTLEGQWHGVTETMSVTTAGEFEWMQHSHLWASQATSPVPCDVLVDASTDSSDDEQAVQRASKALGFMPKRCGACCGPYGLADLNAPEYTHSWVWQAYSLWLNNREGTPAMTNVVLAVTEQWQLSQRGDHTAEWWRPLAGAAIRALVVCAPAEAELPDKVNHPDKYLGVWHQHGFSPTSFELLREFYADWGEVVALPWAAPPPVSLVAEVYIPGRARPALSEVWGSAIPAPDALSAHVVPRLVLRESHWHSWHGRQVPVWQASWRNRQAARGLLGGVRVPPLDAEDAKRALTTTGASPAMKVLRGNDNSQLPRARIASVVSPDRLGLPTRWTGGAAVRVRPISPDGTATGIPPLRSETRGRLNAPTAHMLLAVGAATAESCGVRVPPVSTVMPEQARLAAVDLTSPWQKPLLQSLVEDQSEYAIRPADLSVLQEMVDGLDGARAGSRCGNTTAQDESYMRSWERFCISRGTPKWRLLDRNNLTFKQRQRESVLQADFVIYHYNHMKARGREYPLPSSAVAALSGVRTPGGHIMTAATRWLMRRGWPWCYMTACRNISWSTASSRRYPSGRSP
jgi:hypothetical protein